MSQHAGELKWHTSYWPLVVSVGILFLVPLSFIFHFVYHKSFLAILSLGIGTPLVIISIVGWIKEGLEDEHGYGSGLSVWAMPFFIIAEALLFFGFFAAYWVTRLTATQWPPAGTPHFDGSIPIIMTVILLASSFTAHFAETSLHKENRSAMNFWLIATIVLGAIFLGFTMFEWKELYHEGFTISTNIFSSSFYSITGFHASHVIVGLGLFIAIFIPALFGKTNMPFLRSASIYWHFVDVVWLFVVTQIYFW